MSWVAKGGGKSQRLSPVSGQSGTEYARPRTGTSQTLAPSPDLFPGINDEDAIGLDYTTLDRILWRLERQMPPDDVARELGLKTDVVDYVARLREDARPMNEPPEVPRVLAS
ncbi:MAG: hypothetical protein ACYC1C_06720 [Chloroflexota bacterium]